MRVVLLCGGSGTRFDNVYPKPMNLVNGTHLIWYVINSVPWTNLTVVYTKVLDVYSFREYLLKTFPQKNFEFFRLDYQTRGPAESLYVGLKTVADQDEQVLVLDNDNVYTGLGEMPTWQLYTLQQEPVWVFPLFLRRDEAGRHRQDDTRALTDLKSHLYGRVWFQQPAGVSVRVSRRHTQRPIGEFPVKGCSKLGQPGKGSPSRRPTRVLLTRHGR
jgi:hypothetical protein